MPIEVPALIKEIYRQARLQHVPPPAVARVVKLLYLADLEWRRRHGREPLTNLAWRFWHFGPYATELAEVLGGEEVEVESRELERGKTARRIVFDIDVPDKPEVPEQVSALLGELVKEWGDADLNALLDYVYFETEPMDEARRGEPLDFSRISETKPRVRPRFDQEKLTALRSRLRDRVKALNLPRSALVVPFSFEQMERLWDEDDRPVRIRPDLPIKFGGD